MVDLNKYNEYLQIIRLLKHESFKQKHWEVLWLEIKNSRNHIDITKTTLKELIFDENIMKYSNFIYKISNVLTKTTIHY